MSTPGLENETFPNHFLKLPLSESLLKSSLEKSVFIVKVQKIHQASYVTAQSVTRETLNAAISHLNSSSGNVQFQTPLAVSKVQNPFVSANHNALWSTVDTSAGTKSMVLGPKGGINAFMLGLGTAK